MKHFKKRKFIFPACEIMINDTISSFSTKKYHQNINGIKVTKYVQVVHAVVNECKGRTVLQRNKT